MPIHVHDNIDNSILFYCFSILDSSFFRDASFNVNHMLVRDNIGCAGYAGYCQGAAGAA